MMLAPWLLALYAVAFLGALFALAYWGDRAAAAGRVPQFAGWVYALSLGVHCTSWAYYGTVGQAASLGWALPPTYIGVMALYLLLPAVLYKLIKVSQRERISSVADFVAARFGRDRALAVAVTLIATCGVIPYIALQLKAIDLSFTALALPAAGIEPAGDTSLYVTAVLAAFAMLFGARHVDATEHHPGMMVALAFGSALKLAAFIAVGLFVTFGLFDGFGDLAAQAAAIEGLEAARAAQSSTARYLALAVLGFCAIFCLPWQFHVGVVEARGTGDLRLARLAFPAYLLAISLFVLPIANGGLVLGLGDADLFVLALPLSAGAGELALLAFIGGLAAATGMVIVACVALATMLCNEMAVPLAMRLYPALRSRPDLTGVLLNVRRAAIALLLAAAWVYHRAVAQQDALASIGELALAAAALLAPAILAGLYWRRASRNGALASLVAGFAVWAWTLLVPTLVQAGFAPGTWLADGPAGIAWLRPTALLGLEGLAPLAHGVLASLAAATAALVAGTLLSERSLLERVQSAAFVDADAGAAARAFDRQRERLTVRELKALTERFVGARRAASHFAALGAGGAEDAQASGEQLEATQRLLAAVVGASSASRLLEAAVAGRQLPIEDVVSLVDGASQALEFSRELLQATLENVSHGISVVDSELRVVAWNRRYLELYRYPAGFVRVGRPVEDLLRYNAERGELGPGDPEEAVARRLDHLRKRTPYVFERQRADGTVLDIRGNPMPGGGFVTSYADITGYKRAQRALEEANESLERRVRERTQALSAMNAELSEAKAAAERANLGKTRFLAAAGHDLLQPLNAAGLFAGALAQKLDSEAQRALLADLEGCLGSAEALLSDLLDISKLDAGVIRASVGEFPLDELLGELEGEFRLQAAARGLTLCVRRSGCSVRTDRKLLKRVLQNFASNALRYTERGGVVIGARRAGGILRVGAWDTGVGIPPEQRRRVFEEFYRASPRHAGRDAEGFGLGLAIVERIARVLGHGLGLRSRPGRGSAFWIEVPRSVAAAPAAVTRAEFRPAGELAGVRVLCVDNDPAALRGLASLLQSWDCVVAPYHSLADLKHRGLPAGFQPDVLVVDYHLDDGATGLDVVALLSQGRDEEPPTLVVSADANEQVRAEAESRACVFLRKPLKPLALRSALRRLADAAAPRLGQQTRGPA
jgi:Na+/proline symporter/signal transduction histidine kinase/CheY-like chemotaxis protein